MVIYSIVDLPIYPLKMVIFHSYVSLPEGNLMVSLAEQNTPVRFLRLGRPSVADLLELEKVDG